MMARKKKQEGKNDAYTEKVPQDVAKNKSRTPLFSSVLQGKVPLG